MIKLKPEASEDDHLNLLGALNCSTACFWGRQTFFPKGGYADGKWEERLEWDGTKLKQFPLPKEYPLEVTRLLDRLAQELSALEPMRLAEENRLTAEALAAARAEAESIRERMIALQEELDWECYRHYGMVEASAELEWPQERLADLPGIRLGERPFEILMAREMEAGELETTWFERHGSVPSVGIPETFPSELRKLWERRLEAIEADKNLQLIERPEYKRRWNTESWEKRQARALEAWLQNRLEWVLSGRDLMAEARGGGEPGVPTREPELLSCAALADRLRADEPFLSVAALYRERSDFDLVKLVTELVEAQGVPLLPVLRFQPGGLRKREAWEEVWDLQRKEDAVEAEISAAHPVPNTDTQKEELRALIREAKQRRVGDIAPPPKYAAKDFRSAVWWSLRGKLDVPKERYLLFPRCERDGDPTPVLSWAGWNHLQQAQALAAAYERARHEGWSDTRRIPFLAGLLELLPWLKQWHNDIDPAFQERLGDFFAVFVEGEARTMGKTLQDIKGWTL